MAVQGQTLGDALIARVIADKFRLRAIIGAGASGAVFQADQMALGRTVAVKILRPELAEDPRIVNRFHDEALAASRLNHPNTVSIIDYGQTNDGLLYLVMEYLRGQTLTQALQQGFPLSPAWIADVVGQVLAGLEEAHAAAVIHADLKSDNIVVEQRRDDWNLVKVVDFGVARIIGVSEHDHKTICGTPEYMAPEVISGGEPTFASDLYAVGVVLYELLAGVTPFAQGSIMEVLGRHLEEQPQPPSLRHPNLSIHAGLEAVALKALAKDPRQRYADATAFRAALAEAIGYRKPTTQEQVLCSGCGVLGPASYKFCPECGLPRTGPQRMEPVDAPPDEFDDDSAGGLLPLPLVGRAAEIHQVREFIGGSGDPSLLLVSGGPGSGRSTVVRAACREAAEKGATIFITGPDPSGLASTLYPIRSLVAAVLELPPVCPYEELVAAVVRRGLSERDAPGIGELFGHDGELWQLEPPVRRRELLASSTRVLKSAGEQGRAVLVFEDLHLYDQPSQELVRRAVEVAGDRPLRIIALCSTRFAEQWEAGARRLEIGPLEQPALDDLAAHLHRSSRPGMPGGAALRAKTGGSPAAVQHLARYLIEGGSLDGAPDSLSDLISARLGLLPHPAMIACQAVAVFGEEVSREVLVRSLAGQLSKKGVDDAIAVLRGRGILIDDSGAVGFPQRLVRDVVYDSTPADVRRTLHASAAQALRSSVAGPAVVGHHNQMAGNLAVAAELLARAGDEGVHHFDDAGAAELYQRALSVSRQLMLESDDEDARIRFVTIAVKLAEALRVGGELGLARGVVEEAKSYCRDAPDLEAQLLRAHSHIVASEGHAGLALDILRRAIGMAIPTGKTELLCELYLDISATHLRSGYSANASAELEEVVDLVTAGEGPSAQHGPDILWRVLLRLAQLHAALDQPSRARDLGEHALRHARRVGSRVGSARVQAMLAAHYERLGNVQKAERYRQAAVDEMRRLGDRRGTAELLLQGVDPTRTMLRITPGSLREARELALEVGWLEGAQRAGRRVD